MVHITLQLLPLISIHHKFIEWMNTQESTGGKQPENIPVTNIKTYGSLLAWIFFHFSLFHCV